MRYDELSKVRFDDLGKIITGKTPSTKVNQYWDGKIQFITPKDIQVNKYVNETDRYITEEGLKAINNILLGKGAVAVSCIGNIGYVGKIIHKAVTNQQLNAIVPNQYYDSDYVYYLMKNSWSLFKSLENQSTTVSIINKSQFSSLEVSVFKEKKKQKAIANILSSLDDKIELNNKINKNLEELAQTLYKRWFVDFEFPNEDGEPYKSSGGEMVESELGLIPKAWIVKSVNQIVDIINGYSYKGIELANSDIAMATIKNFSRNGGFQIDGFKELIPSKNIKDNLKLNELDMIIACTDLTQNAEIIGNIALLMSKDKYNEIIISMDLVKLVPIDQVNKLFIYESLKDKKFKDYAVSCTSGTTVLHLNKNAAFNYKISIPSESKIIIYFNDIVSKIYEKITNNLKTTDKLIKLRNELLPKLMNGEIEVPVEE